MVVGVADPRQPDAAVCGRPNRRGMAATKARAASDAAADGLPESLEATVWDLNRALARALRAALAVHNVTIAQWRFLRVLSNGDGLSQRELCRRVGVAEAIAVAMLNGLEARGLVRRNRGATDRRRSKVQLTVNGQELCPVLEVAARQVVRGAMVGVDPDQVRRALGALRRITVNLSGAPFADRLGGEGDDDG